MDRGERLRAPHVAAGYVRLRDYEGEILQNAIAIAIGVIAEIVLVASFELWVGGALFGLLVAWILLCFLPPLRRIEGRSSVQVACTPEAAFALVSDPQNWRLWTSELEVIELSEVPVRRGTVVHSRMRIAGRLLEGDERVVAFDPPRRCGREVLDVRGAGYDSYEMTATERGTLITYAARFMRPLDRAALGEALRPSNFFEERWKKKMQRIKQLLEDGAARSV
ncbi:MAG TPA: SRPBCC family protein [Candidatus Dormibacteraeota bacterium]|nr:SRPBCC family protein [Candidatus Dormibacteraeota bacterium]